MCLAAAFCKILHSGHYPTQRLSHFQERPWEFSLVHTTPRGCRILYLEGQFNGGFFALPVWGAYIWGGLLIFGIFTVFW